ncbi:MAG: GTP-binding protein [Pseudomonadota bacterium]
MIAFTVIGGYLGAGKTTLVNHLLRHNQESRLALLINDFGDINIDGDLIESEDDNQINLTNGCVCCTLSDGFFAAIEQLQALEPLPDHIVVEASGVADVAQLSQYGNMPGLALNGVVILADAETVQNKAKDKYVAQTVQRQLAAADLLILNKVDLISAERRSALELWLASISDAQIICADRAQVPVEIVLGVYARSLRPSGHGHERYATWSATTGPITSAQAQAFAQALDAIDLLRAKGLIPLSEGGVLELHKVGKRLSTQVHPDQYRDQGDVVAIDLDQKLVVNVLDEVASEYLRP